MVWRKAWARTWDDVRYCSDACRSRRGRGIDDHAQRLLLAAVVRSPSPIDPESVLAQLEPMRGSLSDAQLREALRSAARRLAAAGEIDVIVQGRAVDASRLRGPMLVRAASALRGAPGARSARRS